MDTEDNLAVSFLEEPEDQHIEGFKIESQDSGGEDLSKEGQTEARLDLMFRVTEMLTTMRRSSELYENTLALLFNVFHKAERGVLFLADKESNNIILEPPASIKFRNRGNKKDVALPISKTIIRKSIKERTCLLINNAQDSQVLHTQSIMENEINNILTCPLFHEAALKGVIVIESSSFAAFDNDDQRLLSAVGSQLALALNAFDTLQEKLREEKVREQLERYATPELALKIQNGEHNITLGGEKTDGVVLFSDLVGFTAMSERLAPEKTVERINLILERMVKCIFKYGGSVDKFGGDSIMAHWNILSEMESPEEKAVFTAIDMQNNLFRFSMMHLDEDEETVRMGIGINSGEVVAGNIGTENRMDYTLIGETVNIAARLEAKAGGNIIFATPYVHEGLKDRVLSVRVKETRFKNVSTPIPVYSIRGIWVKDGYRTSIPVTINAKQVGKIEARLTLLNEEVAYVESNFKMKVDRDVVISLWLTELPDGPKRSNQFKVLKISVIETTPRTIYRTKLLLGDGFLKDWLQSRELESPLTGDEIKRNPSLN